MSRAFSRLLDIPKQACRGVFLGGTAPQSPLPERHPQGKRSRRWLFPPLAGLFGALLLLLMPRPLPAQFSGPALSVGAQANQSLTPTTDPALLNPGIADSEITPGDVLTVRIFGQPDFAPPVQVTAEGNIQLPLIGVVPVGGLTIYRAESSIAERLQDAGMYKNPQVTVGLTSAATQFATVSGEMHALVPLAGSRRLLDVLAAAGSLPPNASHVVTILRPGVEKPIVVDLGTDPLRSAQANIPILPHDTILIARVGVVYILGAFRTQGYIPLQQTSPLTLMEAAALSGGVTFEGKQGDLRIIRTVGLERKMVRVNIHDVLYGKDPDPVLQADDIVFLPPSTLKRILASNSISTLTSVVSLLLVAFRP